MTLLFMSDGLGQSDILLLCTKLAKILIPYFQFEDKQLEETLN